MCTKRLSWIKGKAQCQQQAAQLRVGDQHSRPAIIPPLEGFIFFFFLSGFLQASVYQKGISSPLGHLDFSEPTPVWRTLNICPTGLTNEKLLSVVGKGRGLSFTVQIAESASEIMLDEPRTVNVQRNEVSVFQFIPPQGISDKQLDITATSQSNLAAYLKVSQTCEDVSENLQVVD